MKTRMPMNYWNKPALALAICHPITAVNSATGYIRISRENVIMYLHRWLWEELKGPIPAGYTIDHENGQKPDCRMNNLRCVPEAINRRNVGKRLDNISGVTGVSLWTAGNAWRASAQKLNGKHWCKTFSIKKYGYDMAFDLACDAREEMIEELNLAGAGYTARHGT